ncbi:MAG: site-2 protease family protein [Saprospiraceae bacterium]
MKGTFQIFRINKIPVKLHWTFFILIVYMIVAGWYEDVNYVAVLLNCLFVLAVFICIILHELGHALTAKFFGIETMEVVILPVGGVAFIDSRRMGTFEEFVIALAGPLTNLVIAAGLWLFVFIIDPLNLEYIELKDQLSNFSISFSRRLMWINIFIFAFNLIPTLPMDGGVMLRSILTKFNGREQAAKIQFILSLLFSLGFLVYSYAFHAVEYLFFAWFLYFSARLRK